ncbi:alpha/beta hydrolase [Amycolatopsis minnesotensis]|uniref:Alpha/beta fold hydrolase n=1 Tax=Amycolatopsis minnesotensis TaxID=337894 RepID=A0ABN2SWZ9_9PSEU
MNREEFLFGEVGRRCAAWLYRPSDPGARPPCVVMAHGLGAVRAMGLDSYASRFADAGMAVLVFDYRGFGDSEGEPRQVVDIDSQLRDWAAAVDCARRFPGVDGTRIALWGTSFSGGHVLTLAARDPRFAAVVSQVPYLGLPARRGLPRGHTIRLALSALRDRARAVVRVRPLLLQTIGEPGSRAFLREAGAEEKFRSLLAPGASWHNTVAARVVLGLPRYRPGDQAADVECPLLLCACENDAITPLAPVAEAALAAPRAELCSYQGEHFDIYRGPVFDRAVTDQIRFLRRHLTLPA